MTNPAHSKAKHNDTKYLKKFTQITTMNPENNVYMQMIHQGQKTATLTTTSHPCGK